MHRLAMKTTIRNDQLFFGVVLNQIKPTRQDLLEYLKYIKIVLKCKQYFFTDRIR